MTKPRRIIEKCLPPEADNKQYYAGGLCADCTCTQFCTACRFVNDGRAYIDICGTAADIEGVIYHARRLHFTPRFEKYPAMQEGFLYLLRIDVTEQEYHLNRFKWAVA